MRLKNPIIAGIMTASMAFMAPFASASPASSADQAETGSLASEVAAADSAPEIIGDERDSMVSAAENAFEKYASSQSQGSYNIADVTVKPADEGLATVMVPVNGETPGGSLVAIFDEDREPADVIEFGVHETSPTSGIVSMYHNGDLVNEEEAHAPDTAGEVAPKVSLDWGKVNDCLSNAGIPSWIVAGVSVACSAGCLVTAGAACAACIAAAATVTGATAGACVGAGLE